MNKFYCVVLAVVFCVSIFGQNISVQKMNPSGDKTDSQVALDVATSCLHDWLRIQVNQSQDPNYLKAVANNSALTEMALKQIARMQTVYDNIYNTKKKVKK